jgi:hypothetical protein
MLPKLKWRGRTADLQPPLGINGGHCKVVDRINQRVRDPDEKRGLIRQVLRGVGLDNKDSMAIYSLEPEKLNGMPFVLGPHLQYKMDFRSITIDQVRKGLLNYYNAAKSGTAPKVTRDTKTTWLDPSGLEMSIGVSAAKGVLMVITAYWKGKPDPKAPADGCGTMKVADATREHADTIETRTASMSEMKSFMKKFVNELPNPENNDLQWEVDYRINYEKFLDPVFAGSRKRDALGFVSEVTGKPHCVVTVTFRSQVELPRHIQGYGFIETQAVMDPNGYVRVVETKRVLSIPEYQRSLVNWVDKRSKHIQTMLPEAQKAQEKNNLERAQREEAYRKEKEMQAPPPPKPKAPILKDAKPYLDEVLDKLNKFVSAKGLDVDSFQVKDASLSNPGSGVRYPGYMLVSNYRDIKYGYEYQLHFSFYKNLEVSGDFKVHQWIWSTPGGPAPKYKGLSPGALYNSISEGLENTARVKTPGTNMEDIASNVKSAVKALRGESFEVYETSKFSISFGFRTWDIPKEFEDQDEDETERVLSKFKARILNHIGSDVPVMVSLYKGDKNYVEGEVTLTASPARVASRLMSAAPVARITPSVRSNIAKVFQQKGLDGNGRFKSFGSILNAIDEALATQGIVSSDDSWDLNPRGDNGTIKLSLRWENNDVIPTSMCILNWHKFVETTGNYEAVVYLS